jgi:hypothetical protein
MRFEVTFKIQKLSIYGIELSFFAMFPSVKYFQNF